MNLTHPSDVKALLDELQFRPSKALGQNFLIDANIRRIMLAAAEVLPDEGVLEIGPGLGVLTEGLLRAGARVLAVEKDRRLADYLRRRFAGEPRLELVCADALALNLNERLQRGLTSVVSNLPYAAGSRILVELFEAEAAPSRIVVTVQREVAARLAARAGTADYGLLSVLAQLRYQITVLKAISATCFYPPPKVRSAIVVCARLPAPAVPPPDRTRLKWLAQTAFAHRRKQLTAIFRQVPGAAPAGADVAAWLRAAGLDPHARPGELTPADWVRLAGRPGS